MKDTVVIKVVHIMQQEQQTSNLLPGDSTEWILGVCFIAVLMFIIIMVIRGALTFLR